MRNETRKFPLNVVLTVTTGRLLTSSDKPNDNGIGDLYDILGWMTDDEPYTHQLGRFSDECKPWLLAEFPRLAELEADVKEMCDETWPSAETFRYFVKGALWGMAAKIEQREFEIPKGCVRDHQPRNPIGELVEMMGGPERVVVVALPESNNP